jgi:hypothetical protein
MEFIPVNSNFVHTAVDLNCQNLMFFTYSRFGAFGHFGLDAVLLLHSEKLLGGCHHLRRDFHGGNQLNENGLEVKEYEKIFFKFCTWLVRLIYSCIYIRNNSEIDLVPFGVTFVFCVFVGLSQGILIGTAVNLGMLLYSTARPRIRIHKIKVFLFHMIN